MQFIIIDKKYFKGVNLVWFLSLTPSLDVDLSAFVTLTAKLATFAKISVALKNLIHATHLHAVQEQLAWSTILAIPSAGIFISLLCKVQNKRLFEIVITK